MRRVLSALGVGAFGALPLFLPIALGPPLVAYLLTDGRGWIAFAAVLAGVGVLLAERPLPSRIERLRSSFAAVSERSFFGFLFGIGLALMLFSLPGWRANATVFGGDEPKYLRMAESLARDLDVDVASASQLPPSLARTATNARRLIRSTGDAIAGLFAGDPVAEGHAWSLGNWTVAGAHGGHYYVQSPGLPILLFPATLAQAILFPDRPDVALALGTLALLFAFGFAETALLASTLAGDRATGLLVGAAGFACAPLLVGGFHFYPETAAVALVPWIVRHALADRPIATPLAAALGFGLGFLPWLHPKFLLLTLVLGALLAVRLPASRPRAAALAGAFLSLTTLVLYDHRVTGLFLPDALYRRFGSSVYQGPGSLVSAKLLNGLVTAFFGARDGIFVIGPWFAAAALAAWAAVRRASRPTLALLAVVASLAIAAAVHEGGAPGPPGRLMSPVAPALLALLALGLPALRGSLAFCLTLALVGTISLSITLGMLDDQRRTVNPYRDVFSAPAEDFSRDLPDGPGRREAPLALHKSRDLARGALLFGGLLSLGWFFSRPGQEPNAKAAILWLAGLWLSVAATAWCLTALGP